MIYDLLESDEKKMTADSINCK